MPDAPSHPSENTTYKPTVLVVDDQITAAKMLCRIFESEGYKAIAAFDGETALEHASTALPDLILLDIMMPGIDGLEVLRRLRDNPLTTNIPAILVTASDRLESIEQGLQLGADDYIPKPIKPREVVARAKNKIEARRFQQQLTQRTRDLEALVRVGQELNSHILRIEELLDLLLYLVMDLLPCKIAAIYHMRQWAQVDNYRYAAKQADADEEFINLQPLLNDFARTDIVTWEDQRIRCREAYPHGMAIALRQAGALYGVILLLASTPYNTHHERLLDGVGRQATLALSNAEAFDLKTNYAESLAQMVEKKSQELQSAQTLLIQAEKLASVGRLAAGIAHEINNPLMPVIINLEDMYADAQDNKAPDPRDIEETLNSAKRIRRIVERMMQFIRRRDANSAIMETIDISNIINNVIILSRKFFKQGKINIQTRISPGLLIQGNRDQLEQVFLNVLINAHDAMPDGGTLIVEGYAMGENAVLRFEDDGIGIEAHMLDKIFEPFMTTKPEGSGLGLFISYEIIKSHNGSITVDSTAGKGTIIHVALPLLKDI